MALDALTIAQQGIQADALLIAIQGLGDVSTPTPQVTVSGGGFAPIVVRKRRKRKVRDDIEAAIRLMTALPDDAPAEAIEEAKTIARVAAAPAGQSDVAYVMESVRRIEAVLVHYDRLRRILADQEEDDDVAILLLQ